MNGGGKDVQRLSSVVNDHWPLSNAMPGRRHSSALIDLHRQWRRQIFDMFSTVATMG
jgi:hypothetical protein